VSGRVLVRRPTVEHDDAAAVRRVGVRAAQLITEPLRSARVGADHCHQPVQSTRRYTCSVTGRTAINNYDTAPSAELDTRQQ